MKRKSKIDLLKEALKAKLQEQKSVVTIMEAKRADRDGLWSKLLDERAMYAESVILELDSTDENFRDTFNRWQAVRDEYLLLLSLLASPDKRAEKVSGEIVQLKKTLDDALKIGETSGQY